MKSQEIAGAPDAIILFAHGARDARWSLTLGTLADLVRQQIGPSVRVEAAYLEFQVPTLAESLSAARQAGARRIAVAPVFWASGGHVANDLPALLQRWREENPGIQVELLPVLSELPGMLKFIASAIAQGATRGAPKGDSCR